MSSILAASKAEKSRQILAFEEPTEMTKFEITGLKSQRVKGKPAHEDSEEKEESRQKPELA